MRSSRPGGDSHAAYAKTTVNRNSSSLWTSATARVPRRLTPNALKLSSRGSRSARGTNVTRSENRATQVRSSDFQCVVDQSPVGGGTQSARTPDGGRGASCRRARSQCASAINASQTDRRFTFHETSSITLQTYSVMTTQLPSKELASLAAVRLGGCRGCLLYTSDADDDLLCVDL